MADAIRCSRTPTLKELGSTDDGGLARVALPKDIARDRGRVREGHGQGRRARSSWISKAGPFGILYKPSAEFAKFLAEQDATFGVLMKEAGITK
jgi:hypothetical protein